MHIPKSVIPTAVVAVALGLGSPVFAQHRRGGGDGGTVQVRIAVPKVTARQRRERRSRLRRGRPRAPAPAPLRPSVPTTVPAATLGGSQPRAQGTAVPRAFRSASEWRAPTGTGLPERRPYRYSGNRNYGYSNNSGYRNYSYRGHGYYCRAPVHFYHPYHSFRPRFSIGFGLWAGIRCRTRTGPTTRSSTGRTTTVTRRRSTRRTRTRRVLTPPYPHSAYPPPTISAVVAALSADRAGSELDRRSAGAGESRRPEFRHHAADAQVLWTVISSGPWDQFSPSSQPLGLSAGRHRLEYRSAGLPDAQLRRGHHVRPGAAVSGRHGAAMNSRLGMAVVTIADDGRPRGSL